MVLLQGHTEVFLPGTELPGTHQGIHIENLQHKNKMNFYVLEKDLRRNNNFSKQPWSIQHKNAFQ